MTFPYWQYDGQQIHIISKGDKEKAQLKQFLNTKIVLLAAQNKKYPLLSIYQIKSTEINSLLNL